MSFFNKLLTQPTSLNIWTFDPSINKTGYSLLQCNDENIEIAAIGLLISSESASVEEKILQITEQATVLLNRFRTQGLANTIVIIEKPPETVYNQKLGGKAAIGRATQIYKLCMVYGALLVAIRQRGFTYLPIYPIEWQRKIKQRNEDIKEISLVLANQRLEGRDVEYSGGVIRSPTLSGKSDENIADAINLGWHIWNERKKFGIKVTV